MQLFADKLSCWPTAKLLGGACLQESSKSKVLQWEEWKDLAEKSQVLVREFIDKHGDREAQMYERVRLYP